MIEKWGKVYAKSLLSIEDVVAVRFSLGLR